MDKMLEVREGWRSSRRLEVEEWAEDADVGWRSLRWIELDGGSGGNSKSSQAIAVIKGHERCA